MKTNLFEMLGIRVPFVVRRVINCVEYLFIAWFASMVLYVLFKNLGLDFLKTIQDMSGVDFSIGAYTYITAFCLFFLFLTAVIGISLAQIVIEVVCRVHRR